MRKLLTTVSLVLAMATPALAEDMTIEMLNKRDDGAKMVYSEDIARIDVGDTITWVPSSKGHNVEFIAGPDGWEAPKKSKLNKEVAITFDTPGVYLYQCSPHKSMGMIAIVVVGDGDNDMVFLAHMEDVDIYCTDTELSLSGSTISGEIFNATDSITTNCDGFACHP